MENRTEFESRPDREVDRRRVDKPRIVQANFDIERVSKLITICKETLQWAGLKPIYDAAFRELTEIAANLTPAVGLPMEPHQPPLPPVNK